MSVSVTTPTGNTNRKRVALVIGAGAVKCAAALGLWKVLSREGIALDMLVGCSGGSLYAAAMALGYDADQCVEMTMRLWNRKVTEKRHWPSLLSAALPQLFRFSEHFGMVDDGPMVRALQTAFGGRTFADTRLPLYIVATDLRDGEQVVLSQGKLLDAVRASSSIPFIWPAWPVGDRLLVDGGVLNPMPVDVAIKEGADIILAMGFESPYPRRIQSISRYAFHINSLMINNLFRANFAFQNLAHHAEIIPIMPEFERPIGLFDTDQFPHVIAFGEHAAQAQMPYIRRLLAAPS